MCASAHKTTSRAGGKKSFSYQKPPLLQSRRSGNRIESKGGLSSKMNDSKSLSHTKWNCKYHIVFAPKYRRQIVYGKIKAEIGRILRQLCDMKQVEIHEAEACADHIHMLVSIPPSISVSQFMGYLKGKSSLMIFDRHANLKYKYGNRHFWCRGYYVDTVGRKDSEIYPGTIAIGCSCGSTLVQGIHRPVYGWQDREGIKKAA